jgi:putative nucleotidyltransferase with HDIG domain
MTELPRAARAYVCSVAVVCIAAIGFAIPHVHHVADMLGLCALIVLCVSVLTVSETDSQFDVNLGFVLGITAILVTGAAGAMLVAGSSALGYVRGGRPPVKRIFNAAQCALSGGASGLVYGALGGQVHTLQPGDFPRVIFVLSCAVVVYGLVNHILVWAVICFSQGLSLRRQWREAVPLTSSPYLAYGFLGLLMAALWVNVNPVTATLLLIPLLVTRTTFANYVEQQQAYDATVAALIQAVETKDQYTRGHSERVAGGSVLIAEQLGLRQEKVKALRYAGMLHDVGKMGVPTKVLQKHGRLTGAEADAIRAHPARGLEMLGDIEFLQEALGGIYHHHERMDGKGYPLGLKGMEIPEFARVIMVADAFDSMTSNRSYRPAMSIENAIDELVACSGLQFDPVMVDAMVTALRIRGWRVQGAEKARLPYPKVSLSGIGDGGSSPASPVLPRQVSAYSSVETDS